MKNKQGKTPIDLALTKEILQVSYIELSTQIFENYIKFLKTRVAEQSKELTHFSPQKTSPTAKRSPTLGIA